MTISIRLNETDSELIRNYAKLKNQSVSQIMRSAIMEQIEMEMDLKAYEEALKEYEQDSETYSQEEVEEALGFKHV